MQLFKILAFTACLPRFEIEVPILLDRDSAVREGQIMTRREFVDIAENAQGIRDIAQRKVSIDSLHIDFAFYVGMFE